MLISEACAKNKDVNVGPCPLAGPGAEPVGADGKDAAGPAHHVPGTALV